MAIYIYYKEHAPPHFHAEYGDFEVTIEIESGIVSGRFPRRALNLVLEHRAWGQVLQSNNYSVVKKHKASILMRDCKT